MPKAKKHDEHEQQIAELTMDLQRMRADFENYRKRVEAEKLAARSAGQTSSVMKLLPVLDTIERATAHMPAEIAEHPWARGIGGLQKQLDTLMSEINITKIEAARGTIFDPEYHQAVQFDEDATGDTEVIDEELQPGYLLDGTVIRPSMVKVTRA